jgi:trehalose/maltose hydrolase-like predicted phosphorylase
MKGRDTMRSRKGFVAVLIAATCVRSAALDGQDTSYVLSTRDPVNPWPTQIGNGRLALNTSSLGTAPTYSYMAGIFEHAPGDVPRMASLPAWNEMNVSNGRSWLNNANVSASSLQSYRQALDMRTGSMSTSYDWVDGDRRTSIDATEFVSQADQHLGVIRLAIVPHYNGRLSVSFPLRAWSSPPRLELGEIKQYKPEWNVVRDLWYPGHMDPTQRNVQFDVHRGEGFLRMTSHPAGATATVAQAVALVWPRDLANPSTRQAALPDSIGIEISFDAVAERSYTFYKYAGIVSSPESARPMGLARQVARAARSRGYASLWNDNARAWRSLWQSSIEIDGNPELQTLVRSMQFYLLSNAREGTAMGVGPMGLSPGYYGHIFWDSDTWMFPSLLLTHPDIAKSLVMFRARTLGAAQRNAKSHGYRGAMYPWEADEIGEETTPAFAGQNAQYEIHVTGDVPLAQWQYYLATGDRDWLARYGYPVISETADFWVSRASFDATRDRYDIRKVVSVDEGLVGITNDSYTNSIALRNLQIADAASRVLGRRADPLWAKVAAKLVIPFDSTKQYHPTYEGAKPGSEGGNIPLLTFPLEMAMSDSVSFNDLNYALKLLAQQGAGGMMTITLYPLIAAELGQRNLIDSLLVRKVYERYPHGPFLVLSETPTNQSVNFLTGAGGFLQQFIYGYTGLRLTENGVAPKFKPILPSSIRKLTVHNVHSRGKRYDVIVEGDSRRMIERE